MGRSHVYNARKKNTDKVSMNDEICVYFSAAMETFRKNEIKHRSHIQACSFTLGCWVFRLNWILEKKLCVFFFLKNQFKHRVDISNHWTCLKNCFIIERWRTIVVSLKRLVMSFFLTAYFLSKMFRIWKIHELTRNLFLWRSTYWVHHHVVQWQPATSRTGRFCFIFSILCNPEVP